MLKTKEKLEAAREKWQSVPPQSFDNIISSVESHMDQAVVGLDCQTAAWKTLGICASVHHYVNDNSRVELGELKSKSDRFLEITRSQKQDIDVVIDFINELTDQIKTWADSTEDIIKNIEENPAEYLEKYEDVRTVLRNGIDKMKNGAEQLLVDSITTIRSSSRMINPSRLLGRNDEHRQFAEENILQLSTELSQSEARRYFLVFNEAKFSLKQTRQELRRLAYRTFNDRR